MSKISPDASSKLAKFVAQKTQIADDDVKFVDTDKRKIIAKTYKFNSLDVDLLKKLVDKVNKESTYKIYSEADIMRGLIFYAESVLDISKFFKALKKRDYA